VDSISRLPDHYQAKIDSLLQAKAQLLESKISGLRSQTSGISKDLDSLSNSRVGELVNGNLDKLTPEQYTAKLNGINESIQSTKDMSTAGFFLHGEYERMNTAVETGSATDEIYRHWKSRALVGIGKEYSFVKGIKGQVMVL